MPVAVAAGDSMVSVTVSATAAQVKLWWPRGKGAQPRYNLTATVSAGGAKLVATRAVGFRVVHMITTNDTDASYVAKNADADGSGNHGMMFRVNGGGLYAKGANFIPMDNMEGRYTASAHDAAVLSASDSNINFLRVWGGGVFLPEAFYEAADKYGVLLFHDMMFTTTSQTHEPKGTEEEKQELQNAIALSKHVSLHMAPKDLAIDSKASVTLSVDGLKVTVSSSSTVLFVTLVTLAQGRFSDNVFLLPAGESVTVEFVPFDGFDAALFKSSLRVEHV